MDQGGETLGKGWEGSERVEGVPNTLPKSFTKFGYPSTSLVSFYRKSAGVLQDVSGISTRCSGISTGCSKIGFWRMGE